MNTADVINNALKSNAGQSTRSEDLENYSKFIVDPIDFSLLQRNTNQLIIGRRGSGKTLVSCALNESIQKNIQTKKVMSFYYSALLFSNSPVYDSGMPSIREKTHGLFIVFIEQLAQDVLELTDKILNKPSLLEYFGLSRSEDAKKRDRLETCVLELVDATKFGLEYTIPSSIKTTGENETVMTEEEADKARLKADINTNINSFKSSLNMAVKSESSSSFTTTSTNKSIYSTNRVFSPYRIRKLLVEIINLLGLEYLIIFIDEWMKLDECQVEFAEILRKCLFGERSISVKIAADINQSSFNNSGQGYNFRGLEVGADIFEGVNLEIPFREQHQLLALALYKRLSYFEPKLLKCFGNQSSFNWQYFIDSIFANRHAFEELCNGAHGICRDFHMIFQAASKLHNNNIKQQKIGFDTVRKAILNKAYMTYSSILNNVGANYLFYQIIIPHVKHSQSRYFIVPKNAIRDSRVIKDLLSKRLIHSIPLDWIHNSLHGEYDVYELDYGIYLDLMKAQEFSTGKIDANNSNTVEVFGITSRGMKKYLLDLAALDSPRKEEEKTLLCVNCMKEFSSYQPSYVKKGLCPFCYEKT